MTQPVKKFWVTVGDILMELPESTPVRYRISTDVEEKNFAPLFAASKDAIDLEVFWDNQWQEAYLSSPPVVSTFTIEVRHPSHLKSEDLKHKIHRILSGSDFFESVLGFNLKLLKSV
jgi:hypothetical protein